MSSDRKEHSFRFSGSEYTFVTDNGVFSKDSVDQGSEIFLEALAKEDMQGTILDLGCGYGVIGIVVKKMFPGVNVLGVDVNPRAAELAVVNAGINHADIEIRVSDGFANVPETFDWVVVNPPIRAGKRVVYGMFAEAYAHLRKGGALMVVIRRRQGAESAVKELQNLFGSCTVTARKKGYWILKSLKLTD